MKKALEEKGFIAMTVIEMMGRGEQKGINLQYRGGKMEVDILPKLKLELFVSDEDVDKAMKAICEAGRTGKPGDGQDLRLPSGKIRQGEDGRGLYLTDPRPNPLMGTRVRRMLRGSLGSIQRANFL